MGLLSLQTLTAGEGEQTTHSRDVLSVLALVVRQHDVGNRVGAGALAPLVLKRLLQA
jgi:hypothetical protein